MKVLNKAELTVEQKLGMVMCATLSHGEADLAYVLEKIRNHSCGAVWVNPRFGFTEEIIARVREVADYPILIVCDSESGVEPYDIPQQIAITAAGARDEDAYSFGLATAALRRAQGYNMICNPVVDICCGNTPCGATTRTFGSDIDTVTRLAKGWRAVCVTRGCLYVPSIIRAAMQGSPTIPICGRTWPPIPRRRCVPPICAPILSFAAQGSLTA